MLQPSSPSPTSPATPRPSRRRTRLTLRNPQLSSLDYIFLAFSTVYCQLKEWMGIRNSQTITGSPSFSIKSLRPKPTRSASTPIRHSPRIKSKGDSGLPSNSPKPPKPSAALGVGIANALGLKKKTLVLDLDETLVHSTSRGVRGWDYVIEVMVEKHNFLYYVYKRPYVDLFLTKIAEWYKLVIFTASMPEYADPVIDFLDASRGIISARYFRSSCTNYNGSYMKNLAMIEPDLSQIALLDNSPVSYAFNQANGIPIDGWINDSNDEALLDLLPFLDALRFTEDVRSILGLRVC